MPTEVAQRGGHLQQHPGRRRQVHHRRERQRRMRHRLQRGRVTPAWASPNSSCGASASAVARFMPRCTPSAWAARLSDTTWCRCISATGRAAASGGNVAAKASSDSQGQVQTDPQHRNVSSPRRGCGSGQIDERGRRQPRRHGIRQPTSAPCSAPIGTSTGRTSRLRGPADRARRAATGDSMAGSRRCSGCSSGGPRRLSTLTASWSTPAARSPRRSGDALGDDWADASRSTKAGPSWAWAASCRRRTRSGARRGGSQASTAPT